MKKIIDGKRYDTETAELIHKWRSSSSSDFKSCTEMLYRTKSGAWFLYGQGGIRPMVAGEALGWLEQHGGDKQIEKYFPDQVTDA